MSDRLLDKYTRGSTLPASSSGEESSDAEDFGCFGWLRGIRDRATMLQLQKKDGRILALPYGWLEAIELIPERGITLHLPGRKVRITGSGLNVEARPAVRLFDGLARHRVPWVRETSRPELLQPGGSGLIVEAITWDE